MVTMTGVNDNYSQLEPHADGTKEATAVERIEEETNEEGMVTHGNPIVCVCGGVCTYVILGVE